METTEERITTLHPEAGKQGVSILKRRYDHVRAAALQVLEAGPITLNQLYEQAGNLLKDQGFDGNTSWYLISIKLDLEARGIIRRLPKVSPQQIELVKEKG